MDSIKIIQLLIEACLAVFLTYLQRNLANNTEITKTNLQEIKKFKEEYTAVSQKSIRCIHDLKDKVDGLKVHVDGLIEP